MSFYRLDFKRHLAEEGDAWEAVPRLTCATCGLRYVPIGKSFPVPEDGVARVDAFLFEATNDSFLYVAGLLLARVDVVAVLKRARIEGFSIRPATVSVEDGEPQGMPQYAWIAIEGRCVLADVWDHVVSVCPTCGTPRTERAVASQRLVRMVQPPEDGTDVCRSREAAAGIIVSQRFKDVVTEGVADALEVVEFLPLESAAP